MTKAITLLATLLAILCVFIALRIEWFNANSRTVHLPRQPNSGKWRVLSPSTAKRLVERDYRFTHNLTDDSKLSELQKLELEASIRARYGDLEIYKQDIAFRAFVGSWGLLQYLLVPVLSCLSIYLGIKKQPTIVWACSFGSIAVVCGLLMLYRQYFNSLGW